MSINKKILNYIKENGIIQSDLCKKLGYTQANLSRILNSDDIKVSQLEKICEALNINVGYFFGAEENQNSILLKRISELEEMLEDKKFRIAIYDRIDKERIEKWGNELIDEKFIDFSNERRIKAIKFITGGRLAAFRKRKFIDENIIIKYKEDVLKDLELFVEFEDDIDDFE